jgi:hypothetical protein
LLRESCPDVTAPPQLLLPEYDPVMELVDAVASPDTVAVQAAYGTSKPPAAMEIVNRIDDPDTVPESDPRPFAPLLVSVIVTVPEMAASDCVTCHAICPGPDESDAVPCQAPLTFTGGVGVGVGVGDGCVDDDPPPHAADRAIAAMTSVHSGHRPLECRPHSAVLTLVASPSAFAKATADRRSAKRGGWSTRSGRAP